MDNGNNTHQLLVSLSCASDTNFASGINIIPLLYVTDQLAYYMSKVSRIFKQWYKLYSLYKKTISGNTPVKQRFTFADGSHNILEVTEIIFVARGR